jgi:NAD(P)-dependent dehydrogenase (short-subunit alcohol dehydrogenase family)
MPSTVSVPYSISKTALNAMTVEYSRTKGNEGVLFQCASPGHCKTEFNGWRGTKDPLDGAKVIVELAFCEREKYPMGFWQMEGNDKEPQPIDW